MNNPDEKRQRKRQRRKEESSTDNNDKPRKFRRNLDRSHDIFVASLSGDAALAEKTTNTEEFDRYNLQGIESSNKKNRTGQRARKAKITAMEAKKKGKKWDTSVNWRPKKGKKSRNEKEETVAATTASPPKAQDVASVGKDWKKKEHPSWLAAKREQKSGIVAFAGTKIIFD